MMHIRFISALAVLAAVLFSCQKFDREAPAAQQEGDDSTITLYFSHPGGSGAGTKATTGMATERGEDDFNENVIESVDCFFYTNSGTTGNASLLALGLHPEKMDIAGFADSTVYRVKIRYTADDATSLFGSVDSGSCKVYVIANASLGYDESDTRVSTLKGMVVERDFGAMLSQDRFVMSAYNPLTEEMDNPAPEDDLATVTLSTEAGKHVASGIVPLKRAAAKIRAYVKLPGWMDSEETRIVDGNQVIIERRWFPMPSGYQMKISLSTGMKKGYVDAAYTPSDDDYISYSQRDMYHIDPEDEVLYETVEENGVNVSRPKGYNYTHTPFYSYPFSWGDLDSRASNFLIEVPWLPRQMKRVADPENPGETILVVDESVPPGDVETRTYQISANIKGQEGFGRNRYYRVFVEINSLNGLDQNRDIIIQSCSYYISDWLRQGISMAGHGLVDGNFVQYRYLVVDPLTVTLNNVYSETFSFVSSSNVSAVISRISFDKYTSGSAVNTDVTPNATSYSFSSSLDPNAYSVSVDNDERIISFNHSMANVYESRYIEITVTNTDGNSQVIKITQNPSISLATDTGMVGNVYVNGYFGRVQYPAGATAWSTSYTSNGSTYYRCNTGWSSSSASTDYGTVTNGSNLVSTLTTFYTTEVVITGFSNSNYTYNYYDGGATSLSTEVYRIGDPRVLATSVYSPWSLANYLYYNNGAEATKAWTSAELNAIKICSSSSADRNIIAPKILVSSALNSNNGLTDVTAIVKRGATYQEAGYPAGRWRLPTEAEAAYIISRQKDGTIPALFATDSGNAATNSSNHSYYLMGSGRVLAYRTDGSIRFYATNQIGSNKIYERYVYDLWYWGDDPVEGAYAQYTIAP